MTGRGVLVAVAIALAVPVGPAQVAVGQVPSAVVVGLRLNGQASGKYFGGAVALIGDVNGDTVADFAIAAPAYFTSLPGSVHIYSGADWTQIRSLDGAAGEWFGAALAGAGDVNADGRADLLVGAPHAAPGGRGNAGSVFLYSGLNGTVLRRLDGEAAGDLFGTAVAAVGDVTGDGVADFLIGALHARPSGLFNAGSAYLYNGAEGTLEGRFDGAAAGDEFGVSVAGAGDVNGDGTPDMIIGADVTDSGGQPDSGSAYVFSGASGGVIWSWHGEAAFDRFGYAVGGVGDANGDGTPDLLIGAPVTDSGAADAGSAYLYSGADGGLIRRSDGEAAGDWFGWSLAAPGDVNGDGRADLLIGAPNADPGGAGEAGSAYVHSGSDGNLIRRFDGETSGDHFGWSAGLVGDANGDGLADLLIGAPYADPGGLGEAGSAWMVTACCAPMAINGGASCTSSRNVTLDLAVVGGAQMRFRNAGGSWTAWEPYLSTKAWALPIGDGLRVVYAQFTDARGNQSAEVQDEVTLDTRVPTADSVAISDGAQCVSGWQVSLTLAATDAFEMRFQNESRGWSTWEPFATTKDWGLSAGRGLKKVSFQCRDACAYESNVVDDTIWIPSFEDVPCTDTTWSHVETLVANRITSGCTLTPPRYCPYANITRAQMAVFLCRAAGKGPLNKEVPTFADVPTTDIYYGYIERLADASSWGGTAVTSGCRADNPATPENEALFCPYWPVTREQMSKFLCLATGMAPMPSCSGTFADVGEGNIFCRFIERIADGASWPGGLPVTSGCVCPSGYPQGAQCYCPKSNVTRAQMAVFIVRAFGLAL